MTRTALALLVVLGLAAGCWRTQVDDRPLGNHVDVAPSGPDPLLITGRRAGPFTARTEATEAALQKLVPSLRVVPNDLGHEAGVVYDVLDGNERLYYVVPDDAPGWSDDSGVPHQYASTLFAVFAVSPRVRVDGRDWRVGSPFTDARGLERCECWGNREVTACFTPGKRVRVIFELPCDDAERVGPRAMLGKPIARLMWKRVVEAEPAETDEVWQQP